MASTYEIEIEVTAKGTAVLKSIDETAGAIEKKFVAINSQIDQMFKHIDAIGGKAKEMGVELAKIRELASVSGEIKREVTGLGDQLETKVIPNLKTFIDLFSKFDKLADSWLEKLPLITKAVGEFGEEIGKIGLKVAPFLNKLRDIGTTTPTGTGIWEWIDKAGDITSILGLLGLVLGALNLIVTISPAAGEAIAAAAAAAGSGLLPVLIIAGGILLYLAQIAGLIALADWAIPWVGKKIWGEDYPGGGPIGTFKMGGEFAKELFTGGLLDKDWDYIYSKYKDYGSYKKWKEEDKKRQGEHKQKWRKGIDYWPHQPEVPPSTEWSKLWAGGKDTGDLKGMLPMGKTPEGVDVWDATGKETAAMKAIGSSSLNAAAFSPLLHFLWTFLFETVTEVGEAPEDAEPLRRFFPVSADYILPFSMEDYMESQWELQPYPEDLPPESWRFWNPSPVMRYTPRAPREYLPQYERLTEPRQPTPGDVPLQERNEELWEGFLRDLGEGARLGPSFSPEDFACPGGYPAGALAAAYGGEGGAGGAGKTITLYQTIEKVDINTTEKVDADTLIEIAGTLLKKEADTLA